MILSLCIATIAYFQRNPLFEVMILKHFSLRSVSVRIPCVVIMTNNYSKLEKCQDHLWQIWIILSISNANFENINYVMTQILKLSCVSFSYVSMCLPFRVHWKSVQNVKRPNFFTEEDTELIRRNLHAHISGYTQVWQATQQNSSSKQLYMAIWRKCYGYDSNVCFKKTGTKPSNNTLLHFVPVFLKQTLHPHFGAHISG